MRSYRLSIPIVLALFLALIVAPVRPAVAEPVKIRIGWITAPASLVPMLFLKPGIAKHHGKSYTFEPTNFGSSNLQITAISQGEIDIAAFGYTSFPLPAGTAGLAVLPTLPVESR